MIAWRNLWKLGIGVALFVFLIYQVGMEEIANAFLSVNFFYLPLIFLLIVLVTLFNPLTLTSLYPPLRTEKVPIGLFFKIRLLSQIFGNVTPNKIGEFYLLFVLKKRFRIQITPIFHLFVIDKAISVMHFLFFGIIGVILLFGDEQISFVLAGIFLAILLGAAGVFFGFQKIQKISFRWLHLEKTQALRNFFSFLPVYTRKHFGFILLCGFLTFLSFVLTTILGQVILYALGVRVSFWIYFLVINLISVAALIPLHLTGFGIKEVTSIYLLTVIGVPIVEATSAVILFVVLRYAVYFILFLTVRIKERESYLLSS